MSEHIIQQKGESAVDLTFTALEEDFIGKWPAKMHIENAEYKCKLFYVGADSDPHSDVGVYAADRAAGRLTRRYLMLARCEPKDRLREVNLALRAGYVVLEPLPMGSTLMIREAQRLAENLLAAIGSAKALDDFITARFGPAE